MLLYELRDSMLCEVKKCLFLILSERINVRKLVLKCKSNFRFEKKNLDKYRAIVELVRKMHQCFVKLLVKKSQLCFIQFADGFSRNLAFLGIHETTASVTVF